jgi:DNA-binding GntR family transcriptional regulator
MLCAFVFKATSCDGLTSQPGCGAFFVNRVASFNRSTYRRTKGKRMSRSILVNPSPLPRQVAERLRDAIVGRELPVSGRSIEGDPIQQIGVSRSSVTEALRQPESGRLIVQPATRGVEIRIRSAKEVEIYQVRIALEGWPLNFLAAAPVKR